MSASADQSTVWFDPRWFDLCSGVTSRSYCIPNPTWTKKTQTIFLSTNLYSNLPPLSCVPQLSFAINHKMVKSRITASRRLRAQVKKHQKTRRGGHNGFSPRLRELNSGDVPWEMPSGGKSKFKERRKTYVAKNIWMSSVDIVFCHLFYVLPCVSLYVSLSPGE